VQDLVISTKAEGRAEKSGRERTTRPIRGRWRRKILRLYSAARKMCYQQLGGSGKRELADGSPIRQRQSLRPCRCHPDISIFFGCVERP
jgi:hypothetical protein